MRQLLKSYTSERQFRVKCNDDYSELINISAWVPQWSILRLIQNLFMSTSPTGKQIDFSQSSGDSTCKFGKVFEIDSKF